MFYEFFHRLMFPGLVAIVIVTVWIVGWSQCLTAEADKGTWPALRVPHHVSHLQTSADQAVP